MTITTKFEPGQLVHHITDPRGSVGCIVAFMVRGQNHSYQVQWNIDKDIWHLEYELLPAEEKREIGLWRKQPAS